MEYVLIAFLLLGSAFFSGTEIAYTSLSKLKMMRENENPTAVPLLFGGMAVGFLRLWICSHKPVLSVCGYRCVNGLGL